MKRDLNAFFLYIFGRYFLFQKSIFIFKFEIFLFLFNFKPIVNLQKRAQRVPICHNSPQSALLHKYDVKNQRTEYRYNAILNIQSIFKMYPFCY